VSVKQEQALLVSARITFAFPAEAAVPNKGRRK